MSAQMLFACSKCFARHPFEELSTGQQLCKECRGTFPIVKCTYCRSEFQQTSKGNTSTICKKCEQNVKQYGKPSTCECCNLLAAFVGSKCQRCSSSELKYGPAVSCEHCKQRCAFDRHDDNKKIDGKLLCWLCTLSYKRALAKARQVESERRMNKKRPSTDKSIKESGSSSGGGGGGSSGAKKTVRAEVVKQTLPEIPEKIARNNANNSVPIDPNSSEHVVVITQLKEQIASLERRLQQKDRELLSKDKHITELKSKNFTSENELRTKQKDSEKYYETKVDVLNKKVASLLKEVAQLSKGVKKRYGGDGGNSRGADSNNGASKYDKSENLSTVASVSSSGKDSGGSGTDSPNTN